MHFFRLNNKVTISLERGARGRRLERDWICMLGRGAQGWSDLHTGAREESNLGDCDLLAGAIKIGQCCLLKET